MSVLIPDEPVPFVEALKHLVEKDILPTSFNTAQMRTVDDRIRRNSFWSAQNTIESILQEEKNVIQSILQPTTGMSTDRESEQNPSGFVTSGFNPATARTRIKEMFDQMGYTPPEGTEGGLLDLSSDKRINLVIKTQTQLSHGAGRYVQENADADVVDLFPALEFTRFEEREEPRNWKQRWTIAAQVAGDVDAARVLEETGRMVALKSSDIWQELGDGAGGYTDTLGNPYPPFAFNSGMWTEEVSRSEAVDLGLIDDGEKAEPAKFDLESLFGIPA